MKRLYPCVGVSYDMNGDGELDVVFTKDPDHEEVPRVYNPYVGDTLVFLKDQERVWIDKLYFYLIPAVDLVKNPYLSQNPGW